MLVLFKAAVAMAGCGVIGAVLSVPVYKFTGWQKRRKGDK